MKLQRTIFACIASLLLCTTVLFAGVKTDYDRNANFSQYKTYSWENVKTRDQLLVPRIEEAVNAGLAAKGWTQVPAGGSVLINAIDINRNQQTLNTFYDGMGGGWRWRGVGGFGGSTTTVENYKIGTLVVDVFDANSKTLIWRGSASNTLSNNSEKNIKNLDKEVQKMFAHFPPSPKG
ncbi:MAG TPA: DUF4136 domain-containing protein [Bryobacteraceae bacterium]|nr:DUF4136 domain-containing protein [Bryobacteraceae bacterium]